MIPLWKEARTDLGDVCQRQAIGVSPPDMVYTIFRVWTSTTEICDSRKSLAYLFNGLLVVVVQAITPSRTHSN